MFAAYFGKVRLADRGCESPCQGGFRGFLASELEDLENGKRSSGRCGQPFIGPNQERGTSRPRFGNAASTSGPWLLAPRFCPFAP